MTMNNITNFDKLLHALSTTSICKSKAIKYLPGNAHCPQGMPYGPIELVNVNYSPSLRRPIGLSSAIRRVRIIILNVDTAAVELLLGDRTCYEWLRLYRYCL